MKLLLDTCTFLWVATDPSKLSQPATELIQNRSNRVLLSSVSAWEITLKTGLGQLSLAAPADELIPRVRAAYGIDDLPLSESAAFHLPRLPTVHRDPFDRMLICQAIAESATLLTPDSEIRKYPVQTAW